MSTHLIEANALFLHIPQTGGTFVQNVLKALDVKRAEVPNTVGHKHALPRHIPNCHEFSFRFCFIRYPLDWYRSVWRFDVVRPKNLQVWKAYRWHPHLPLTEHIADSFDESIRRWIKHEPGYCTRLFEQYCGLGTDELEFIGRTHQLGGDLGIVLRRLGYDAPQEKIDAVPIANSSPGPPIPEWDADLKKTVENLDWPGVARWGKKR